ncbi:MAG TPA: Ig-like domain-containing protein, partial [Polyangia bacterium]
MLEDRKGERRSSCHPRLRTNRPLAPLAVLFAALTVVGACGGDDPPSGTGGMGGTNRRTEPGLGGSSGTADGGLPEAGGEPDAGTPDVVVEPDLGAPDVVTGPPSIVSTSPANDGKDVPIDSSVIIEFSKPMNRTSVMVTFAPAVTLRAPTWSAGSETLTLSPQTGFVPATMYTVTVAGSDVAGAALTGSKTFVFVTGTPPDMTAPTIAMTTPAAGATGVAANTPLTITFSEAMDPTTVTAKLGDEELDLTFNPAGTVATAMNPGLKPATMYTVAVTGSDVAGNMLGGTKTFSFTTSAPPDTEKPKVTDTTPDNAATGVASATEIALMFSEGMNRTTTEAAITISGGVSCAGRWLWNTANNFASCKPAAALTASTSYTVTVAATATDAAGNTMMAPHSFSFTTAALPDVLPPTITAVSPTNASNGVARTASIIVDFSEPMDLASAQTAFQATVNGNAITAAGTYAWSNGGRRLTFKPNAQFLYGATVGFSVSMAAKDAAGNAKTVANSYSFTVIRLVTTTLYAVPATDGYVYSNALVYRTNPSAVV